MDTPPGKKYPRSKSQAGGYPVLRREDVPSTPELFGEDEPSIPVMINPGTMPPPQGSRVKGYYSAESYAEADQRRLERTVDRAVAPVQRQLDDHITQWRRVEESKADDRIAVSTSLQIVKRELEHLSNQVGGIKADRETETRERKEASKVSDGRRWDVWKIVFGIVAAVATTGLLILLGLR